MENMEVACNYQPKPKYDTREALNLVIASVGLEEIALAKVIDAEANKIQAAVECFCTKHYEKCCPEDLLKINESARKTLEVVANKEILLLQKLETAIEALKCHSMK